MDTSRDRIAAVRVRGIRDSDARELERFYERLSDQSRWCRFLGATHGLSHSQSMFLCSPDHAHREGLVAVVEGQRAEADTIIAHLCLEPTGDGGAEIAVAVADEWQGQGIGGRLVRAGIAWARDAGMARLDATMAATNVRIHRLLRGLGLPLTMRRSGDLTALTIDLTAGVRTPDRAAA